MIIGESGIYLGVVIMGAMILLVTAFLIVKSTPKKGTTKTQPLENIEMEVALKKESASPSGAMNTGKVSAIRKIKGDILKGIRALRKRSTSPDQQPIDEGLAIKEQLSTRLPDLASLGLQGSTLPSLANREELNTEPADEPESEGNMVDTAPVEPEQGLSNVAPVSEPETEVNMTDSSPAELAKSNQEPLPEGLERAEPESEEEYKAPDNEPQEQPEAKKDVIDMFMDEMVEESETSKFASTLDNVDVHDLL